MSNIDDTSLDGSKQKLSAIALVALGVVFGDISTSPLYAIRECFHGEFGIGITHDSILGVLSLMFWALTIIVSLKYLTFILRADNRGEGGVIALTALLMSAVKMQKRRRRLLIAIGIFAACLLYGDGMITPAISVLSAAEGLRIITPHFEPFVIPVTLLILAGLFLLQHRGTAKVGSLFGPVMLAWLLALGILGIRQIVQHPSILQALAPWHGARFLMNSGIHGFAVLGAVFLVVTGAEALYADLGHFGRKPIRVVWFGLVLPALLLNYFGQGALLLSHPEMAHHPFYATVPVWAVIPMVILATCATIIASQAVITGVFSLTKQAVQLGYLPRMNIVHTSSRHFGQIYVSEINWFMMAATLALVLGFQSSSKLAAAYGVAVTSTMLIATVLFYVVAREKWKWNIIAAGIPTVVFFVVDISFFSANITKIFHGAWFPLVIGGAFLAVMMTWKRGRRILSGQFQKMSVPFEQLRAKLEDENILRVKGYAVFLSGQPGMVPVALTHNLKHNRVLHAKVAFLHFRRAEIPRVPNMEKLTIKDLGSGFHEITVSYGFMEYPNVPNALVLASGQGVDFPIEETSFFLGREKLVWEQGNGISRWRAHLFAFLSRNAYDASSFFGIPQEQVMEVGVRLKI
ncbi:MAG: potassium transporter Kup [candidate division Zixibacteria bacterium]|nr:potassium transporter Kup [candidate division Zixibacteria bacterium]MBU1471044.1 potassium transporter Kup [candidate division Zixibacteria bacterium]MBU2625080.1 potassium transporter Kup [candidate division Zixibacteria bacterium]